MSLVRNVFLTLLFVNLAYFAWSHWIDEPPPPPVNESIARLPRLKLASEDPPPPPSGHAAETGLTVSPALSASPPPGCLSVGPFRDVDAAAERRDPRRALRRQSPRPAEAAASVLVTLSLSRQAGQRRESARDTPPGRLRARR